MKKQYLCLAITGISVIFNVKAQSHIDDFLKKYPSKEGVTHVSMSQEMLRTIFAASNNSSITYYSPADRLEPASLSSTMSISPNIRDSSSIQQSIPLVVSVAVRPDTLFSTRNHALVMPEVMKKLGKVYSASYSASGQEFKQTSYTSSRTIPQNLKVPEAYSSVTITKNVSEKMANDMKKRLIDFNYEQYMEVNKENSNILGYYIKKAKNNTNEIVVLRLQKDQFSAIYIKGDIDINHLNQHLTTIKNTLNRLVADNQINKMLMPSQQFAFSY